MALDLMAVLWRTKHIIRNTVAAFGKPYRLLPFHKFIHKPQVWLDDNVQTAHTDKDVSPDQVDIQTTHHLCNTNRSGTGDANTTMHQ